MKDDIKDALMSLLQAQGDQLGFIDPPQRRIIYANRDGQTLWYFYNGAEEKKEPIDKHAIRGHLIGLEWYLKTWKGETKTKVRFEIKADRSYAIESGLATTFCTTLLRSIAHAPEGALSEPVVIEVQPGDEEKVLFSRLYAAGEAVIVPSEGLEPEQLFANAYRRLTGSEPEAATERGNTYSEERQSASTNGAPPAPSANDERARKFEKAISDLNERINKDGWSEKLAGQIEDYIEPWPRNYKTRVEKLLKSAKQKAQGTPEPDFMPFPEDDGLPF